ncbi:hypothetical protein JZU56_03085, partial [bacterium]|nr:hypothetical protein [bacterium]
MVMDKARTVIATFDHPSTAVFGLTVKMDAAGSGSGTVTSDPGPMYCGPSCYGSYAENSEVTLTATPAAGSIFVAWTDTGATCTESTAGPASCVVKMTEKTTVTAKFDKDPKAPKNLSVIKAGAGAGIVSSDPAGIYCGAFCNETFPLSTLVRLSAAPNSGSIFTGWSGDAWSGDACSGGDLQALTCEVTMDMARSVTATFNLASTSSKKTLYLYKLGTGSGAVTSDPAGIDCPASGCSNASASFDSGTPVTLTLATAVTKGQSVTLAYTDPTTANDGNAIQDVFGNDTISVPVISVTNLTGATGDTMPPKFVQATANGNTLVMSYVDAASKLQDPSSSISTAAFTVKVADVARTVKEVKVNGTSNTVTLTLDPVQVTDPITHDVTTEPAVTEGKSVTVAYTAPATGAVIRDTALNPAATLVATNVTNLTGTQVDFLPPTFALATVNNNKLVLSYTGPYDLNENNLPVVGAFA